MITNKAVVVTTIHGPNEALRAIAATASDWDIIVVGDRKTPNDWSLAGTTFLSVEDQESLGLSFASKCPYNHYARKNIGYLKAIQQGCAIIAETDDDNLPYEGWLRKVERTVEARRVTKGGWENVYRHFSQERIWPRGLPLEHLAGSFPSNSPLAEPASFDCPVQQFLADDNPDVDAIYRLVLDKPVRFEANHIVLGPGTFCPFNSQNTVWWPPAYELMYLPAFVSFRMTDIWRSFVAQACLHAMGRHLYFGPATMYQVRNQHNLLRDFADEVPGYLSNARIMEILAGLRLSASPEAVGHNLHRCYEALISGGFVPTQEMPLLEAWLSDAATASHSRARLPSSAR